MFNDGGKMKKILVAMAVVLLITSCQRKEEPKARYQFPTGPVQTQDDIKLLEDFVKKEPGNVNAWIRLGNTLMDNRRFAEAADAYQKALAIEPKNVDVRVDLGTCYRNIGKPDIAVTEYKKALEIDPRHLNGHRNLGVVLADDLHDKAQAIKEFEKVLELSPNEPDAVQIRQKVQQLKEATK
jgi:cytochrome c-type biogenesis protein CcmH/NrfG